MHFDNPTWWLIVFWNILSYCIYGLGQLKSGSLKEILQFVGGILLIASFVSMFILFGISSGIIFLVASFVIAAPVLGFIVAATANKHHNVR